MSKYSWSEFIEFKNNFDLESIKLCYNSLNSLLTGDSLHNDYTILGKVSKRIAIRLRSAKATRLIKQFKKVLENTIQLKIPDMLRENISTLVVENYDISSGQIILPQEQQIVSLMSVLAKSAPIMTKAVVISLKTFAHCQQWLRTGNLAPHFLMMCTSLARLTYILKSILVYVCDLYSELNRVKVGLKNKHKDCQETNSLPNSLNRYLEELNLKCNQISLKESETKNTPKTLSEDIGVSIERNVCNISQHTTESKTKSKKKRRNENKLKIKTKNEKQLEKPQKQRTKQKANKN